MDPDIFINTVASGRRRRATFTPVFSNELNFTDEQRAVCGNDTACLYDFAVTGDEVVANTALESGQNFSSQVESLSKQIHILHAIFTACKNIA